MIKAFSPLPLLDQLVSVACRSSSIWIFYGSRSGIDKVAFKTDQSVLKYSVISKALISSHQGLIPRIPVIEDMNQRLGGSRRTKALSCRVRERGFTLVELLVVVAIFVALISLTVPNYMATRPQRLLSGEANRLSGTIRQGRLHALRDNDKVYLEFLPEIDTYRLWSSSGWRAYGDLIDVSSDRDPDRGDYDGDLDGDGDCYWNGDPSGEPEDPDVINDPFLGWVYRDTDGTYTDPDVLLMPTYPGNAPIRTVSPKLRIEVDPATGEVTNITRDLGDSGSVAGDNVVPFDVDLRMRNLAAGWANFPLGKRNGVLTHFPLLFIVFFPDGTLAASWDADAPIYDADELEEQETIDLDPGQLGALQIHLQARGDAFNPEEAYRLFHPEDWVNDWTGIDQGPYAPDCPFQTLSTDDANRETFGRVLTVNNMSGRVIIGNYQPSEADDDFDSGDPYTWIM